MPYLTPKNLPIETLCRQIFIPDDTEWIGAVNGALFQLMFATEWEQSEGGITPEEAADRWRQMLTEHWDSSCGDTEKPCRDFAPYDGIIKYTPNDPFLSPEYIPAGYHLPPWYHNALIPLPGVKPNDAMVNLLSLSEVPIAAFAEGLPNFEIRASGIGEMELEFVKIPQGGLVLIQADDAEETKQLIELDSVSVVDLVSLAFLLSLFGLPGDYSVVGTEVIELKFTTPGEHIVNCTFLPSIGGETILGFGGGLRRVTLCGLSTGTEDSMYFRFREKPGNSRIMQAQWVVDGEWFDILDNTCCSPSGSTPVQTRVDPETYGLQVSYDNGATWQTDPTDPRLTQPQLPPLPSETENLKCQAAWNIGVGFGLVAAQFQQFLSVSLDLFAIAAAIAGILAVIIFAPTEAYRLIPVVIQLAKYLTTVSAVEYGNNINSGFVAGVACAAYCSMNASGQITDLQIFAYQLGVKLTGNDIGLNTARLIAFAIGTIGVNNMGSTDQGVTELDCDAVCGCSDFCFDTWLGNVASTNRTTGTDANGDYLAWSSSEIGSNDYRVRVTTDGNYPPTSGTGNCCTPGNGRFHCFVDNAEVPADSIVGWACGETNVENYGAAVDTSWWMVEAKCSVPFEFRIYKTPYTA